MKPLEFLGDSLECLREFPLEARRQAGFQLDRVQLEEAVYVLHCFGKKTQATRKNDIEVAAKRYRELMKEHK